MDMVHLVVTPSGTGVTAQSGALAWVPNTLCYLGGHRSVPEIVKETSLFDWKVVIIGPLQRAK